MYIFALGTARGCTDSIPENVMKQLNQGNSETDKLCTNMTMIELGPESKSTAVAMCVCNHSNCNLGPTRRQDDEMIGAMMPQTEVPDVLPLTGLLINQDLPINFDAIYVIVLDVKH